MNLKPIGLTPIWMPLQVRDQISHAYNIESIASFQADSTG